MAKWKAPFLNGNISPAILRHTFGEDPELQLFLLCNIATNCFNADAFTGVDDGQVRMVHGLVREKIKAVR